MKNMIRDAAILFAITLIAGFVLGFVYNVTKEPIAQAEEKAAKEAYAEVFQDASDFNELAIEVNGKKPDLPMRMWIRPWRPLMRMATDSVTY